MSPSIRRIRIDSDNGADRPAILRTPAFDKALLKLGAQDRARVIVGLQDFEKDWLGGRAIDDIRKQWDYKVPKVSKVCTGLGLRQMHPTNNTRAWLAPHHESGDLLLLYVIRKTSPSEQHRIIERRCQALASSRRN